VVTLPNKNVLSTAVNSIPKLQYGRTLGEDAWLTHDTAIAVADGVGGWNKKGVDPGIFARELCSHVSEGFTPTANLK